MNTLQLRDISYQKNERWQTRIQSGKNLKYIALKPATVERRTATTWWPFLLQESLKVTRKQKSGSRLTEKKQIIQSLKFLAKNNQYSVPLCANLCVPLWFIFFTTEGRGGIRR